MITRLTRPSFPAVSTAELEAWLRIDAGSDPEAVNMLVGSATEYVEAITGLTLGLADYRIDFATQEYCYKLNISPIVSITSVADRGGVPLSGWTLEHGYLHFDSFPAFPPVITLEAGYATTNAIPEGLRHAIALLVAAGFNAREDIDEKTFKTVERLTSRYRKYF